jgi:hypothetical protein
MWRVVVRVMASKGVFMAQTKKEENFQADLRKLLGADYVPGRHYLSQIENKYGKDRVRIEEMKLALVNLGDSI